jgi:hypothetical protein
MTTTPPNPWLTATSTGRPPEPSPSIPRPVPASGPDRPQPGQVSALVGGGLPFIGVPDEHARAAGWWWVGAHGGAGVSTLHALMPDGFEAYRCWPTSTIIRPLRAVLVARTHAAGLAAARDAARQWASGQVPIALLGLVLIADTPGRLPRRLRGSQRLLAGAVPRTWTIAWIESYRLGELDPQRPPAPLARLAADLSALIETGGVHGSGG